MRLVLEDEQKLRDFAASLVPPVELKKSTPSTQGDYRMKGGVNQARQVVDYLNGDRARQLFSTGFPWQVLQHMGLDGALSNMSDRVGLARCIRGYIAGVASTLFGAALLSASTGFASACDLGRSALSVQSHGPHGYGNLFVHIGFRGARDRPQTACRSDGCDWKCQESRWALA